MSTQNSTSISLTVNGTPQELRVPASTTLVELLRSHLQMTGTKVACDGGECGACTVLVDGRPVLSCLILAVEVDGRDVTTIESTSDQRVLGLQRAFVREAALQCGFCTPGIIMAASGLDSGADADEIRAALAGNICRCTGYSKIIRAVQRALGEAAGNDETR